MRSATTYSRITRRLAEPGRFTGLLILLATIFETLGLDAT